MQIIQVYQTEKQEIKKTAMKVLEKIASLLHTGINHNDKLWWNFFFSCLPFLLLLLLPFTLKGN